MPKEYISSEFTRRKAEADGGRPPTIKVTWDRVGYAQIGTVLRGGVEGLPPGMTGPIEGFIDEGWFVDLDRQSINDLIRVLRRARDQAYGRDE